MTMKISICDMSNGGLLRAVEIIEIMEIVETERIP